MFCTACGYEMNTDHRYCARCGKPAADGQYMWSAQPYMPRTRLERDIYHGKIAGVCAGFATYFGVDVTLMRLIWVIVTLFTLVGLVAYPLCWIVMPRNDVRPMIAPADNVA